MNTIAKVAAAAALALSATALTAPVASAAIACNGDTCWHVHSHYTYQPAWGVTVHPDNWRWGTTDHYRWHEHRGRGYWNNGVWVRF